MKSTSISGISGGTPPSPLRSSSGQSEGKIDASKALKKIGSPLSPEERKKLAEKEEKELAALRKKHAEVVNAHIITTAPPRLGMKAIGQPQTGPPLEVQVINTPKVDSPLDLLKRMEEFGGFCSILSGDQQLTGACYVVLIHRAGEGKKIILQQTLLKGNKDALPEMPMGVVPVIVKYGKGWFTFEIPGWGTVEVLPGDPDFQALLARGEQKMVMKFMSRLSPLYPSKSGHPMLILVFNE
jgi:hypothetical protein